MTYKEVLNNGHILKSASAAQLLQLAQKAAIAGVQRLGLRSKPVSAQDATRIYNAMRSLPRFQKRTVLQLPKGIKPPQLLEEESVLPWLRQLDKKNPIRASKFLEAVEKANQRRVQPWESLFSNLQGNQKFFNGFIFDRPPWVRLDNSYNQGTSWSLINSVKLGKGYQNLATLAHQIGHIFDRNAYQSLGMWFKTERQFLLRQLRASALGLRALKEAGYPQAEIKAAREHLKAAFQTYKFGSQATLLKARNAYQELLSSLPPSTFRAPRFESIDSYPKIQKLYKNWMTMQLFGSPAQRAAAKKRYENWRQAIRSSMNIRKIYLDAFNHQKADYNEQLVMRGLPEIQ